MRRARRGTPPRAGEWPPAFPSRVETAIPLQSRSPVGGGIPERRPGDGFRSRDVPRTERNAVTRQDSRSVPLVAGLPVRRRGPRADMELGASCVDGFILSFRETDLDKMQRFHGVSRRRCQRSRQAERAGQRDPSPVGRFIVDDARSRGQALQAVIRHDGLTASVRRGATRPANPRALTPRLGVRDDANAWWPRPVAGGPQSPIAPGDRCVQDHRLLDKGRGSEDTEGLAGRRTELETDRRPRSGSWRDRSRDRRVTDGQRAGAAGSGEQGRFQDYYIIRKTLFIH